MVSMNFNKTILQLKKSLNNRIKEGGFKTVGLGQSAYSRMGASNFLTDYSIICVKDSLENETLKKGGINIASCVNMNLHIDPKNSVGILSSNFFINYIKKNKITHVLVYKTTTKTEELINNLDLKLAGNSAVISESYENKNFFFSLVRKLNLPYPAGEQVKRGALDVKNYSFLERKYHRFVIQRTDMDKGGGLSTYFIASRTDFANFLKESIQNHVTLNITKFIEGKACSATGCVTQNGIICSPLQYQLIDIPQISNTGMKGVWCGHDWLASKKFTDLAQKRKNSILETMGKELFKLGYKGIFGIDFMIDAQDNLYPIECNPRYTGAFPAYTFFQLAKQQIPLELIHLLEHYHVDYDLNIEEVNKQLATFEGSQLILRSLVNEDIIIKSIMKPGKYGFNNGKLEFLSDNNLPLFGSSNEIVICDAIPKIGNKVAAYDRIGKIIFADQIGEEDLSLDEKTKKILDIFYTKLKY